MTALKSLNFTALQKPSTNPTLDRRARVIARLEEQKLLLTNPGYKRSVRSWAKSDQRRKSSRRDKTAHLAVVDGTTQWLVRLLHSVRLEAHRI